jgi:hypothetical protein
MYKKPYKYIKTYREEFWQKFIEIVENNFNFLKTDYGFKINSTEIPFVIYESPFLRVRIYWEFGGRWELDLGITPNKESYYYDHSIGIGRLAGLHGIKNPETFDSLEWGLSINTIEKLEAGVKKLADSLRQYGVKLLSGDFSEIELLKNQDKKTIENIRKNAQRNTLKIKTKK